MEYNAVAFRRGDPGAGVIVLVFELVERIGNRTWLGEVEGGPVVARWLTSPPELPLPALPEVAARIANLRACPSDTLVPVVGVAERDGAIWLLSALDRGIALRRLLQVARLSPSQAATIAADLRTAVATLHATGHGHGRLHAGNVQLGLDGAVRLTDWALESLAGRAGPARLRRADGRATVALAADLHRHAGVPVERLARILGGPEEQAAARAGVAELVAAVPGIGRPRCPAGAPAPPSGPVLVPFQGMPPPGLRRRLLRSLQAVWPALRRAVALLALLAGVVVAEFVLFGEHVGRNLELLRERPAATTGLTTTVRRASLPKLPRASGPVAAVNLRALDPCRAGDACTLVVQVRVRPQAAPLRVSWRFAVAGGCAGNPVTLPGGETQIPPGADRVLRLQTLQLPPGPAVEIAAVTSEPAAITSHPLRLPRGGVEAGDGPC
jgi:hypothetical protein